MAVTNFTTSGGGLPQSLPFGSAQDRRWVSGGDAGAGGGSYPDGYVRGRLIRTSTDSVDIDGHRLGPAAGGAGRVLRDAAGRCPRGHHRSSRGGEVGCAGG